MKETMRSQFSRLMVGGLLCLLLVAIPYTYAQDSSSASGSGNANGNNNPSRSMPTPPDQSYSASLGTGQAIPLTQGANAQQNSEGQATVGGPELHSEFLYGGSLSTVYVDTYNTTNAVEHDVSGV